MREVKEWLVEVLDVHYMPGLEAPPDTPYPFLYSIRITNYSFETITLRGRKWVVKGDHGDISVIEGEGVIGKFPVFSHGDSFEYKSYHVIKQNATVQGAYFGQDSHGQMVFTRIPEFRLMMKH